MPNAAAPRHAYPPTPDGERGPSIRPNYTATVGLLIGAIALFIVAALMLCFDSISEDIDIRPSWIMIVLTAGGCVLIAAHQEWRSALRCARDAERFEILKRVERDQQAIRAEIEGLREFIVDQVGEALAQAKFVGIAQGYRDGQGGGSLAAAVPITSRRTPQPQ